MKKAVFQTQPFLRWAGGKKWLLPKIKDIIPPFKRYYEPFLGGGAILFYLVGLNNNEEYFVSDINQQLVNAYNQLKYKTSKVLDVLRSLKNTPREYYKIRAMDNDDKLFSAARFIYLNKTCFNGLYRVNKRGFFNVPYGRNFKKDYFNEDVLLRISKILKKVKIKSIDFEEALINAEKDDFIFLDPPYTVAHKDNGFVEYNEKIFSWRDQQRLANCVEQLAKRKIKFILTNAVHGNIADLYDGIATKIEVERSSTISGITKNRKKISEYIYTNCI